MQGMDGGAWTDLGTFAWFVGVWVVMMAAMMFPSVAPTVALYSKLRGAIADRATFHVRLSPRVERRGSLAFALAVAADCLPATYLPGIEGVGGSQE